MLRLADRAATRPDKGIVLPILKQLAGVHWSCPGYFLNVGLAAQLTHGQNVEAGCEHRCY